MRFNLAPHLIEFPKCAGPRFIDGAERICTVLEEARRR